ncbi:MAG: class I SAM-dependent methyltransferase [Planctomycetota bacterium]|nr:class I SAM-dependent methyltransferase [Planctomycetota bacterium]MDA1179511.1 class I SAM-dependent methyltransferase [Planctomycetota bacterium]
MRIITRPQVDGLVTETTSWIDVGGGKSLFVQNPRLSKTLAERCVRLVGVDPSANILINPYVQERAHCMIEDYHTDRQFDLATLRMVAEHIDDPQGAIRAFARLLKPGGKLVIFTPNRWSPVPVAASMIPFRFHHPITNFLWGTHDEDVFPTLYKMNTRRCLRQLMEAGGFREAAFTYLDNCTTLQRFYVTCVLELSTRTLLRKIGFRYPENNLLGIYERVS